MTDARHPNESAAVSDAACAARIGQVIRAKWRLDALLGVGGMAAVYAASHRNGQRAALKILHVDFARDKSVLERFLREAYVSNKVGHPGCVSVIDDDVTEQEEPFLVMELLEGQTLRDLWMNTGRRMPVIDVLRIVDPVLDCLAACHAIGVIHRDLKPANIFVTKTNQVKILDFGVAQFRSATSERTAAGTALGTPSYMSPEQAMGLVDQLDGRTDLFSTGAVMYALLSGHRINKGRTENEALVMAATTPVTSLARVAPDLPVGVIALVDKSLQWDRRNRFESAIAMQSAVRVGVAALTGAASGSALAALDRSAQTASVPALAVATPASSLDEARIVLTRDLFKRIERIPASVRQAGWENAATERLLRAAFESLASLLEAEPLPIEVEPYALSLSGQVVWEPAPPLDGIAYNLFASGVRVLRLAHGMVIDELRAVIDLMLLEPGRDLGPDDDFATRFWEAQLPNVTIDLVDFFASGDAAEREAFLGQADEVERAAAHVSGLEARAMSVATAEGALDSSLPVSPMALDDVVRAAYATQLDVPRDRWEARFVDALVEALTSAVREGALDPLLGALRAAAALHVKASDFEAIVRLHRELCERLGAKRSRRTMESLLEPAITEALFGAETVAWLLRAAREDASRVPLLQRVLALLPATELKAVLIELRTPLPEPVVDAFVAYVARVLDGREVDVAASATVSTPTALTKLIAVLARAGTPAARQALATLTESENIDVRVEARVLAAASPEAAHAEISSLCDGGSPAARLTAIRAAARHGLRSVFPTLSRMARAPNFQELPAEERRELLRALLVLSPDHGEPLVLELAKKTTFLAGDRDVTRVLAIELLGERSRSTSVITALREIAGTRWGVSEDLRAAAAAAAERVTQRAEGS